MNEDRLLWVVAFIVYGIGAIGAACNTARTFGDYEYVGPDRRDVARVYHSAKFTAPERVAISFLWPFVVVVMTVLGAHSLIRKLVDASEGEGS